MFGRRAFPFSFVVLRGRSVNRKALILYLTIIQAERSGGPRENSQGWSEVEDSELVEGRRPWLELGLVQAP